MKKRLAAVFLTAMLVFSLAACGEKSKEDVVSSLNNKVEKMSSYTAKAKLTIKSGADPQTYDVEIFHQKPDFYRVLLKNVKKGQSQIILRNGEGVFVLTPALNKSFKFQSDWPQNSSQVYLYESLVKDILLDKDAKFTMSDGGYTFETKTNYHTSNQLPLQEIVLTKDLVPVSVKLMDNDKNALVEVTFSDVKFNGDMNKDIFDVKKNMASAQVEVPTFAQNTTGEIEVLYPSELPEDTKLVDTKELKTPTGKRMMLSYSGKKHFILTEEKSTVAPVSESVAKSGEPVDLGFTVGALTNQSVSWSVDGVDYTVASDDLSQEELLQVARSVGVKAEK